MRFWRLSNLFWIFLNPVQCFKTDAGRSLFLLLFSSQVLFWNKNVQYEIENMIWYIENIVKWKQLIRKSIPYIPAHICTSCAFLAPVTARLAWTQLLRRWRKHPFGRWFHVLVEHALASGYVFFMVSMESLQSSFVSKENSFSQRPPCFDRTNFSMNQKMILK